MLHRLDRELKSFYKFRLSAINKLAADQSQTSVLVEVVLKDLNDNRPEFSQEEYTFFTPEKDSNLVKSLMYSNDLTAFKKHHSKQQQSAKHLVGKIIAMDKDAGLNAELKYFLPAKSAYKSYFELNTKNLRNPYLDDGNALTANEVPLFYGRNMKRDEKEKSRLFKIIDNIEEIVHIDAVTGSVYLLKEFDREQITHIRFRVFVSDRYGEESAGGGGEVALRDSVPVTIEFIDINDSRPECTNVDVRNKHENTFRKKQQFIFAIYVEPPVEEASMIASLPIYRLECVDQDVGKNAELTYEIEKVYLKCIDTNKLQEASMFSPESFIAGLSVEQRQVVGDLRSIHDQYDKETSYLANTQLFTIDSKSGLVSFSYMRSLNNYYQQAMFYNSFFFVLRIKVLDNGMLSSYSNFDLKVKFCLRVYQENELVDSLKYCDFEFYSGRLGSPANQTWIQKLDNVDEELVINDYTVAADGESKHKYHEDRNFVFTSMSSSTADQASNDKEKVFASLTEIHNSFLNNPISGGHSFYKSNSLYNLVLVVIFFYCK